MKGDQELPFLNFVADSDTVAHNLGIKPSELTCNSCENRQRWQCGGRVIQYCSVRKSPRTQNGLLKIKCKDLACHLYSPIENI